MKYNIWIVFLTVLGSFQLTYAQFNFKQHKVVKGEDVYSIAKEYGTTPEAIYQLNPTAKQGIQPNTIIVLPNVITPPEKRVEGITFKKHRTKSKETLYSVAKKYKVTVDDIKEHNDFLNIDPLRKGDIIRIPLPANKVVRKIGGNTAKGTVVVMETTTPGTKFYTVQPKDTRYGVARKFGITIPEMENMNPNLGEGFPIGQQILVSSKEAFEQSAAEAASNPAYELYEVLPKETLYSLGRRYEISVDSIEMLNPNVKEGLKSGMVLRLPNIGTAGLALPGEEPMVVNLQNKIQNPKTKNIAIMLPFGINSVDFSDEEKVKEYLNKSKVVRLTVDFYSGALMAVNEAKKKGISSHIEVCDTQKSDKQVAKLISQKDLKTYDAIIGPLYQKNVEKAASILNSSNVPVFSPISNKELKTNYTNLYQTKPSSSVLEDKMIAFVKKDTLPKNMIIIADSKSGSIKERLKIQFPEAKILDPKDGNFLKEDDLIKVIGEEPTELRTWVFLESKSMELISNVIPFLNARAKTHKITLFTTSKSNAYDSESVLNQHLSKLNLHYPSVYNEASSAYKTRFTGDYIAKYGVRPNNYATRGYDLTYDLLLRLAAKKDEEQLSEGNLLTEYVENKFYYKANEKGGFTNASCYILKYVEGLEIKEVK